MILPPREGPHGRLDYMTYLGYKGPPDYKGPSSSPWEPGYRGPPKYRTPPNHRGPPDYMGPSDQRDPPGHRGPPDHSDPLKQTNIELPAQGQLSSAIALTNDDKNLGTTTKRPNNELLIQAQAVTPES